MINWQNFHFRNFELTQSSSFHFYKSLRIMRPEETFLDFPFLEEVIWTSIFVSHKLIVDLFEFKVFFFAVGTTGIEKIFASPKIRNGEVYMNVDKVSVNFVVQQMLFKVNSVVNPTLSEY